MREKYLWPVTRPDPTRPNPRVYPTRGQLWGRDPVRLQPKSNLVHFSLKIWHLVATILVIFHCSKVVFLAICPMGHFSQFKVAWPIDPMINRPYVYGHSMRLAFEYDSWHCRATFKSSDITTAKSFIVHNSPNSVYDPYYRPSLRESHSLCRSGPPYIMLNFSTSWQWTAFASEKPIPQLYKVFL